MRYFYDCEFLEDGRTIDLASIGIVAEDGREYYAVNANVHWERLGKPEFEWVRDNVWKHLPTSGPGQLSLNRYNPDVKEKRKIAEEVKQFLWYGYAYPVPGHPEPVGKPELWADYPAYDHVALCQLWGRMIDLPNGLPMRTNCLSQLAESLGIKESSFPQQAESTKHHALYDAKHNKLIFDSIHPEAFRQRYMISGAEGVQVGNGNVQTNTFGAPRRRGEEGGEPAISLVTRGKTFGGRAVSDLPHVFPEG